MSPLDKSIIERKLEFVKKNLDALETLLAQEAALTSDSLALMSLERCIERIVEAAVDASSHILKQNFGKAPTTYREALLSLGQRGIVPIALAEKIAPAASLRNRIVHYYEDLDPTLLIQSAKQILQDFPPWMRHVSDYIQASRG